MGQVKSGSNNRFDLLSLLLVNNIIFQKNRTTKSGSTKRREQLTEVYCTWVLRSSDFTSTWDTLKRDFSVARGKNPPPLLALVYLFFQHWSRNVDGNFSRLLPSEKRKQIPRFARLRVDIAGVKYNA